MTMTYTQNGDYLIPNLRLSEQPSKPLGKYGRMRKAYLKTHRPILYNQLLMSEKLYPHLIEIEETAQRRLEQMMPPAGGGSGRDGAVESPRSDAVGGFDEQLQSPGGGDPAGGTDPQLNLFFTEEESSVQAPGSFSLSRQDAEQELLRGSLIQNGSLRIYALYQHNPTVKEAVDFLKEEYGIGGHSYTFWEGGNGYVDYDSKGIHFRRYADQATALLPWKEVDKLLRHLIHSERYLSEEDAQKYAQLEADFSGWPGGVPKPHPCVAFPDPVLDLDSSLIREALAQRGIVDGQVVDQEKLDQDPFVQQVMADAERVAAEEPSFTSEPVAVYPAEQNNIPFDVVVERLHIESPEQAAEEAPPRNFRIFDDQLGEGGPKAKFRANLDAIETLKAIEAEGRSATPEEQEILSRYVGWGGLADAFDPGKENWNKEYSQLKALLTPEEYAAARSSTLNAHYTSPTVIRAIYEAVSRLGFETGNILDKTTPRLIQFHTVKNAVNPLFLGGFSIFGTVAA